MHVAGPGDGGECWASLRPSGSPGPRWDLACSKDVSTWEVASQGAFMSGGGMCFGVWGQASPLEGGRHDPVTQHGEGGRDRSLSCSGRAPLAAQVLVLSTVSSVQLLAHV